LGSLDEHFVPNIHHLPQLDVIHIFCRQKSRHKNWVKIKGVDTYIKPICQALQQVEKQCEQ
jgi:hypothetical protein